MSSSTTTNLKTSIPSMTSLNSNRKHDNQLCNIPIPSSRSASKMITPRKSSLPKSTLNNSNTKVSALPVSSKLQQIPSSNTKQSSIKMITTDKHQNK
jgi:hypothetical protein